MELYFKDLISEEASLDKLVDNLMLVVQGADDFAEAAGDNLVVPKEEFASRLARLKDRVRRLREQAIGGAVAADKVIRQHPYSTLGIAFAAGMLAGILAMRCRDQNAD
jgi:ElaB/YqjD/DUF883 family membrane-anchored ribosome-binding protein